MREEFDQYRAEHLELESMPPLDHAHRTPNATEHVAKDRGLDQGGVLQSLSPYMGKWVYILLVLTFFYFISSQ